MSTLVQKMLFFKRTGNVAKAAEYQQRVEALSAANEAAKLKAALAKVTGELNALKHAQQGDAVNSRKPMAQKAPQKAANKPKAQAPSRPPAARQR